MIDLHHLNDAQRAAVTAGDGAHLVIAGAGTGKTRTLVHRVAWLLEQGATPAGIVLLTFTRRAAREMLDRVATMVGPGAQRVRGGTFHGFAHTQLRRYAPSVGYTQRFTILDRSDAAGLVGTCRAELGLGGKGERFPQKGTVLNVLSKATNTGREIDELLADEYPQYAHLAEDIARVGARYAARKRDQDLMDYDDLLVRFSELLVEHEGPRRRISDSCVHVLVDEYQDTNRVQGLIASMLASQHGNLMVVGDEAQSIYGFRGAEVRNILDFPEVFPGCAVTTLEQNYRSTQSVLDLANAVLDSATERFDKRLHSELGAGKQPVVVDVEEDIDQPDFVVPRVLALREEGVPLSEMAVLFRSAFHANQLEVALTRAGIPFRKFGGIQFAEAAHIKDVFALLRLVANPRDGVSWTRALLWMEGLGAKTAQKLSDDAVVRGTVDLAATKKRKYHGALLDLTRALDTARAVAPSGPTAVLDSLFPYYVELMPRLYDDASGRARDLDTLRVLAAPFDDLDRFLAEVALDPISKADATAEDDDDEWMTLSTIHSAKGLEWDVVFVLQLRDGHFPSAQSLDDEQALDEERRLFYVAVTRARKQLFMLRPHFVRGRGFRGIGPSCSLLDEIRHLGRLVRGPELDEAPRPEPTPAANAAKAAAEERMQRFLAYYGKKKGSP